MARIWERRGAFRFLVRKPEGMKPPGISRHGWEDNIKMHLQEVEWAAQTALIWFRIETGGGLL